jgi:hypothetical protein
MKGYLSPQYIMSHSTALDEMLHRPEVVELVFSTLSPANAFKFCRVARLTRDVMKIVNAGTYSINRHLSNFFTEPLGFRSLQARTGTLISGSIALHFFDRIHESDTPLELYTHPGFAREVGLWLIDEGYRFQPASDDEPQNFLDMDFDVWTPWTTRTDDNIFDSALHLEDAIPGIRAVYRFERESAGQKQEIQIMAAIHTPMQCILGFDSSVFLLRCYCSLLTPVTKPVR